MAQKGVSGYLKNKKDVIRELNKADANYKESGTQAQRDRAKKLQEELKKSYSKIIKKQKARVRK